MTLALTLFVLFAVLATLGLFLLLRHHYGLRPAVGWSLLMLFGFVGLGGWVVWMIRAAGLE